MTSEEKNLLQIATYTGIISTKTNKMYLDEEYFCYLFEFKLTAQDFQKKTPDTIITDPKSYNTMDIANLYANGARGVVITKTDGNSVKIILDKNSIAKQFYNNTANGNICRLKQTKQGKYLRELKDARVFAPILINPRQPKLYPELHYGYAKIEENSKYFILFTTLQEFEKWNEKQKQPCQLMETTFLGFKNIYKDNLVIINPLSDILILNKKNLKIVMEGPKK